MRISDWSSDVCSSDLGRGRRPGRGRCRRARSRCSCRRTPAAAAGASEVVPGAVRIATMPLDSATGQADSARAWFRSDAGLALLESEYPTVVRALRSEEHTSELQSLMRSSYAVFCLKKKTSTNIDRQLHH